VKQEVIQQGSLKGLGGTVLVLLASSKETESTFSPLHIRGSPRHKNCL